MAVTWGGNLLLLQVFLKQLLHQQRRKVGGGLGPRGKGSVVSAGVRMALCVLAHLAGGMCESTRVEEEWMLRAGVGDPLLLLYMQQAMGKCSYNKQQESSTRGGEAESKYRHNPLACSGPSPFALSPALMESSWSSSLTHSYLS